MSGDDRSIHGPNHGGIQNTGDNVNIGNPIPNLSAEMADKIVEMVGGFKPVDIVNIPDARSASIAEQVKSALLERGFKQVSTGNTIIAASPPNGVHVQQHSENTCEITIGYI